VAGVGHGVQEWMGQVGARVESPVTLLREYTAALRALLHGEQVSTSGRYVQLDRVALDWPPAVVPPLLVGAIGPRTVALAGEFADGLILTGGTTADEVGAALGHFRGARPASRGGLADAVVFTSASAGGPAADIAATVGEYGRAGATCVAVNAAERDADLEEFVSFLAREVKPLC
jgi:alkanesulfonate monooxygenase SsuD/methylene tetrahydromethanopterin reductase-like flavin-dependent oxidoreductase (luciferase family)